MKSTVASSESTIGSLPGFDGWLAVTVTVSYVLIAGVTLHEPLERAADRVGCTRFDVSPMRSSQVFVKSVVLVPRLSNTSSMIDSISMSSIVAAFSIVTVKVTVLTRLGHRRRGGRLRDDHRRVLDRHRHREGVVAYAFRLGIRFEVAGVVDLAAVPWLLCQLVQFGSLNRFVPCQRHALDTGDRERDLMRCTGGARIQIPATVSIEVQRGRTEFPEP